MANQTEDVRGRGTLRVPRYPSPAQMPGSLAQNDEALTGTIRKDAPA